MTEWDAADYARISALQKVMADEVLGLLNIKGSERVLDVGAAMGRLPLSSPPGCLADRSSELTHLSR